MNLCARGVLYTAEVSSLTPFRSNELKLQVYIYSSIHFIYIATACLAMSMSGVAMVSD